MYQIILRQVNYCISLFFLSIILFIFTSCNKEKIPEYNEENPETELVSINSPVYIKYLAKTNNKVRSIFHYYTTSGKFKIVVELPGRNLPDGIIYYEGGDYLYYTLYDYMGVEGYKIKIGDKWEPEFYFVNSNYIHSDLILTGKEKYIKRECEVYKNKNPVKFSSLLLYKNLIPLKFITDDKGKTGSFEAQKFSAGVKYDDNFFTPPRDIEYEELKKPPSGEKFFEESAIGLCMYCFKYIR